MLEGEARLLTNSKARPACAKPRPARPDLRQRLGQAGGKGDLQSFQQVAPGANLTIFMLHKALTRQMVPKADGRQMTAEQQIGEIPRAIERRSGGPQPWLSPRINHPSVACSDPDCQLVQVRTKILVVDDEQDMLDLITYNLGGQGYEVETALNGLVALHKVRRNRPDLVVLDLMLGDLDGFSVCEILRQEHASSRIPVLAVTAYGGEIPRLNALDAGADDFLPKPFSPAELVRRVAALLTRRESRHPVVRGNAGWKNGPRD
jgi:CheY-like chemotaxis protein